MIFVIVKKLCSKLKAESSLITHSKSHRRVIMSSLDTFSLSSIILCVAVITTIIFAVSKWSNTAAESKADKNKNVCASCGIAEGDEIKLEECDACKLVRYCSDKCREEHREQHRVKCRKWAKKLRDKVLFRQPDSTHLGECPICFLLMSGDLSKLTIHSCCSKLICHGCNYANDRSNGSDRCPFCREPVDDDEFDNMMIKRVKANDPAASCFMGIDCCDEGDYDGAFEYLTKAAELGNIDAHCKIAEMYEYGEGVEKDMEKAVYYYEMAAIGGHPFARHNLACYEEVNGNVERAVQHYIIAANLGHEESMKALWRHYSGGDITKKDLEVTLRAHQAALDAMKSPQRDAAEAALQK